MDLTEEDDVGGSAGMEEQDSEYGLSKAKKQKSVQKQESIQKHTDNTGMSGGNMQNSFGAGVNNAPVNVYNNPTFTNHHHYGDKTDYMTRQLAPLEETTNRAAKVSGTEAHNFAYDRRHKEEVHQHRVKESDFSARGTEQLELSLSNCIKDEKVLDQLADKVREKLKITDNSNERNLKVMVIDLTKVKHYYRMKTKESIEMTVTIAKFDNSETENIYNFLENLYKEVIEKCKSNDQTPSQGSMVERYISKKFHTFEISLHDIPNEMFQKLTEFNVDKIVYLAEYTPDKSGPIHEFVKRKYIMLARTMMRPLGASNVET